MKRLLAALTISLLSATASFAGVWETNCSGCHNGTVAPSKEQLLKKFHTKQEFMAAVRKMVQAGKMPPGLRYGMAARELFGGAPSFGAKKGVKFHSFSSATTKASSADPYAKYKKFFTPLPALPPIPADNALTPAKVKLGKMLYYDPRLSRSKLISCNTCHNLAIGGDDNLPTSRGDHWRTGGRNAPTTLNSGFLRVQFWDGRAPTLEAQAKGPIQAHVEMNSTPEIVVRRLKAIPEYVKLFKEAFPGEKDPVTFDNVAKAIAAFERTLNTPNSPFQRYLLGDENALTKEQKEGMALFVKFGCTACHNGPVLSDGQFHKFKWNNDLGRYRVTKNPADKYKFRTAQLLNVGVTAPYFHDGSVNSLEEAVKIMAQKELGKKLTDEQAEKIAAFLRSLTGEVPLEARTVPQLPGNNPE
ncbi:cytochrome-c peroxidase [Thermovibrio ammonificans]|uniref:Cytochrome-c peroxidase n=1 Tax=Thermovibrio ammonificans (strain DSM 15698 / JCM 12110 / HB-1) TaxID=648996 RepID=E8T2M5_THEA1|nr:cytochrome-c peroxidase [Thermovibrio ammonificans]ADU97120.1 Cytochrome-c peroxidase [Thermovibrio ammonificans HB-1]